MLRLRIRLISGFPGSTIEVIPRLSQLDTPPEKRKNEGLYKVFAENFPIADTRNNFVLEFLDYYIDRRVIPLMIV